MLKLWKAATSHEDLFIERYERLLAWSLKLTGQDRQLAEDLLHDTFVQFALSRPDLNSIQHLDSYLFAMLRNSHLSHVHRVPYVRTAQLSMAEFDSVEIGLRATDVRDQIKVQDELRLICHYALLRKETSKAGSVLLLRFFHGYYPSEIAQVLMSNLQAVRKWLQLARNEAKLYLDSPTALTFIIEAHSEAKPQIGFARTTEELLNDLRRMIFSSRHGECSSRKKLEELYRLDECHVVDGHHLAHLVSCWSCLDHVNEILRLPLLQDRYPTDMTGKDTTPRGGSGSGGRPSSPTGDESREGSIKRSLRRVKETFEHYPKELLIAVNGHVQVSQKVSSDRMEQTLSLDLDERIGFVEIFSEQWVRLFFLNVNPPPDGAFEQKAHIALSEGRSLEAALDFSGPCPNLQVVYNDPTLIAEGATQTTFEQEASSATQAESSTEEISPLNRVAEQLRRSFLNWSFWLRPGTITALLAVVLIASILFLQLRSVSPPITSVPSLLNQSAAAERAVAGRTDQVLHRTISLEEKSSAGALITRRKLELWHSAERDITVRRLYDERGALLAGDWRRSDGTQTIYHHGSRPQVQRLPEAFANLSFENAWQLSPSAEEFTSLIGQTNSSHLEETTTSYVITYAGVANDSPGLIKGAIVLSRADLRAVELILSIQQGNEQREYRFVEMSYERRPPAAVAPVVFEPDAEFLVNNAETPRNEDTVNAAASPRLPIPASPSLATPELEVEAWRLLNQAGADTGEQMTVVRSSEGVLKIDGLVDTETRKAELLRALAPIANQPAVRVNIRTVAEAVSQARSQNPTREAKPNAVTIERVETANEEFPVKQQLQRHFGSDEETRRFAAQMINRSRRAISHAAALKRLVSQFSSAELRALAPDARAKWLGLIRSHARSFQQETAALRQELSPIFFSGSATGGISGPAITDDSELTKAVFNLFEATVESDGAIRSAFSVSTDKSISPKGVSAELQSALKRAEELAARIQAVR